MAKQKSKKPPKGLPPSAEKQPTAEERAAKRAAVYRIGVVVLVVLLILAVLETFTAFLSRSPVILIIFAVAIGGIIIAYYMHLGDMFD